MKPADLALLRIPGAPTVAPDGRTAVVAVDRLDLDDDAYRGQLWLVPTDGRAEPRPLTHAWRDTAPRYSPDGRWLAFLRTVKDGKPQVMVMPTDGGEPRALTDHPLGASAPVWSPDSTRIAYTSRVPEQGRYGTVEGVGADKEAPRRISTLQYRLDSLGFTVDRWQHVFVVGVAPHAEPAQLTEGDYDHDQPAWTPDGRRIVFSARRHAGRDRDLISDLYTVDLDGGDLRRITDTTLSAGHPTVAPDGTTVYFIAGELGADGRSFVGLNDGLYAVQLDGVAPPRRITEAETVQLSKPNNPLVVTPDGVLIEVEHRGAVELRLADPATGAVRTVLGGRRMVAGHAVAGGLLVATVAGPDSAGELVARDAGGERALTGFGADFGKQVDIRPMEELTATAPDGYPVHGWVLRPASPGPHPVLLLIHGGPFAQYGWKMFDEAQVYTGAGYAVVMGNPRGSSGYGQAHGQWIVGDVGVRSSADVLALLDHALATCDDLDGNRVGVLGGSHGGYMTAWLAAHTDRFRAAIPERGVYALDSFVGSSDIGWFFAEQMYGSDPAALARQSPLSYVDDISIPVLVIHSENDWRCPVEQAQRLYVSLLLRGVEAELLLFPAESHELSRAGLPSHRIARFDAILDWWARHLK